MTFVPSRDQSDYAPLDVRIISCETCGIAARVVYSLEGHWFCADCYLVNSGLRRHPPNLRVLGWPEIPDLLMGVESDG